MIELRSSQYVVVLAVYLLSVNQQVSNTHPKKGEKES